MPPEVNNVENPEEKPEGEPRRVVLDTNVLVAAGYSSKSSSRELVERCLAAEQLVAVLSEPLKKECEFILSRALKGARYVEPLFELLKMAALVEADPRKHYLPEDPEDAKVMATAVSGQTEAIVTNDRYLLSLDPYQGIRVLSPSEYLAMLEEHDAQP